MKTTLFRMAGLGVAAAVVLAASCLWAESKEKKSPPPRTRIGLLNLTYVIKNYEKYKHFQEEVKNDVEPFQQRDRKLKAQIDKLTEELKQRKTDSSVVPAQMDDLEEKLKKLQRELEDNSAKAKKKLAKKNDDQMRILYLDVTEAAQRYATGHDLDLVMQYNDAVTQEDYFSGQNIARKLNTGPLIPLYVKPGMDVSTEVLKQLHRNMPKN